jgi:soluble lytic murein transglycosylase-like protein
MNHLIISLVGLYSQIHGIDPLISISVIDVESKFNPKAVGTKGEIGLFQIMPNN